MGFEMRDQVGTAALGGTVVIRFYYRGVVGLDLVACIRQFGCWYKLVQVKHRPLAHGIYV